VTKAYRFDQLPYELYKKLVKINMHSSGTMQALCYHCYYLEQQISWAVVLFDEDQQILGWALLWRPKAYSTEPAVPRPNHNEPIEETLNRQHALCMLGSGKICEMHVYVRKPYRRNGYGKILVDKCRLIADQYFKMKIYVTPHNRCSRQFFTKQKFAQKYWMETR
jgi:GNAT superfamily N-acetyltransferase